MNAKGGVEDGQKVTRILGCFENPLVNDWISVNRTRLRTLSFEDFMIEFRQRWLPRNWEEDVAMRILSSRLDPKQTTFEEWATQLQTWNVALRGTDSHIDDDQMRRQLDANLDTELRKKTRNEKVTAIRELLPWIQKVAEIDDLRQTEQKRFTDAIDDRLRANKRPYDPARSVNPNRENYRRNTSNSSGTTAAGSSSTTYPPKLMEDERRLLHEHEGCLKCRMFYAGHRADKCTTTLTGRNYKQLTQQDALRAKANKGVTRNPQLASITAPKIDTEAPEANDLLAAIFPTTATADTSFPDSANSSLSSVSHPPTLKCNHFIWNCMVISSTACVPVNETALIDSGANMVFIRADTVAKYQLPMFPLPKPELVSVAIDAKKVATELTHYTKLSVRSCDSVFHSNVMHAVVVQHLCMPIILGLPFLVDNGIVCHYNRRECLAMKLSPPYNLLQPLTPAPLHKRVPNVLAAIRQRLHNLHFEETLAKHNKEMRLRFEKIFGPMPHVDELPDQPRARIKLIDPDLLLKTRNYPCPRKWKEAWHELLKQHIEAGRIRPSSAPAGSGAFIIPKADPTALPRWVNDYRQLNANTITDSFPIPRVNEILADVACGKVFGQLDMTNSFFQTRMHADDVPLTAVNTPWGLYEWVVMPMGIKNAPAIHQRRLSVTLREHIGKICHVYVDDIAIWSKSIEEHHVNVAKVLQTLADNQLYCNPKKSKLFCSKIRFLGH